MHSREVTTRASSLMPKPSFKPPASTRRLPRSSCHMYASAHHDHEAGFRFLSFPAAVVSANEAAIVYLHGAGERGHDLSSIMRYGLPAMLSEQRAITNCTVFCPQLEADQVWQPEKVARFIRFVRATSKSVSLLGFSLGGSGVCNLVATHGPVVEFAMAMAGQGPSCIEANQAGVRLLAIQGELDPWPDTGSFLECVRSAGGHAVDVRLGGQGHFISETALSHPVAVEMLRTAGVSISLLNAA